MPRALRIEYPGAIYHVMNRDDRRGEPSHAQPVPIGQPPTRIDFVSKVRIDPFKRAPIMTALRSILVLLALLQFGLVCASLALLVPCPLVAGDQQVPPLRLKISELIANREKWRGKVVEITGYYFSGPEVSAVYESRERATAAQDKEGLWIDLNVKAEHEHKMKWITKGDVRIIGRFEYKPDGSGHMGCWPAKLTELELMQPIPGDSSKTNKVAVKGS